MRRNKVVEAFNNRKETTRHCRAIKDFSSDEYFINCYVWIINEKNQILIRQRCGHLKTNPNKWETISTIVDYEDDISSKAAYRIVGEEYNITITMDSLEYIGCYKRTRDFVDVWLVRSNATKRQVKVPADKAQDIAWVSPKKYEQMIKEGIAVNTSFDMFRKYYKNFYNK